MNAYNEFYLNDAMKNLGEAFDYATNVCGMTADGFARLFIASGISDCFGRGNPKYVIGKSGTELVMDIIEKTGDQIKYPEFQVEYDCSPEYWAGWSLAYYQWKTARTFREIFNQISIENIINLYPALHEASEEKFADTLDSIMKRKELPTKLQKQRKNYGYSQRELAEKSGINLRTLQQYEVGTKDIRKASISSVLALANTLGCSMEDLI